MRCGYCVEGSFFFSKKVGKRSLLIISRSRYVLEIITITNVGSYHKTGLYCV